MTGASRRGLPCVVLDRPRLRYWDVFRVGCRYTTGHTRTRSDVSDDVAVRVLVPIVVAAGLATSAALHLDLADTYDGVGEQLTVGDLFRVQGVVGLLAALAVLVTRRRLALLIAVLVAAASTAAVVTSVYVRVPPIGPLPELHEPVWYTEKAVSAAATAVAFLVGSAALLRRRPPATRP